MFTLRAGNDLQCEEASIFRANDDALYTWKLCSKILYLAVV